MVLMDKMAVLDPPVVMEHQDSLAPLVNVACKASVDPLVLQDHK